MAVALFVTCLVDTLFPACGQATVRLLERLGVEVDFPAKQTCCGQMHLNSGYAPEAAGLAARLAAAFADAEAVVTPSASCAAMVRESYPRLAERIPDRGAAAAMAALPARTYELTEFLVDVLGVEDVGAYYPHRVTYHPSCHGLRGLRVGDRPLRLLRRVRGLELVELGDAEQCCGFGGTFAVKNADTSAAMLTDKATAVLATGAQVCTALDSSCLMHIGGGLRRARSGVDVVHLAEILAATDAHPVPSR
ncbi:MAG: (Fe-S)-binding protein [Actinobacteria bacterium]|nr:(Fe-S)-binding protein [Actinomycetota bacterium]